MSEFPIIVLDKNSEILYFVEMSKGDSLGEFEHLVLLAVLRLGEAAYGMTVSREIASRTGRDAAIGAVYATLERLEAKQFVQSREEPGSAESGARVRRMYRLTAAGPRAIEKTQHDVARMMDGLRMGRLGFKTR